MQAGTHTDIVRTRSSLYSFYCTPPSALIETANAPIFGVDSDQRVNVWNVRASAITGFTAKEVMGKSFVDEFITPEFRPSVRSVLDKALKGLETANYELAIQTKSGDRLDILTNATSRRDADKNIIGVIGIGQDITGFKLQAEQYKTLVRLSREASWEEDSD